MDLPTAQTALLLAFSTNSLTKIASAFIAGGRRFATLILPGLVLMVGLAWAGVALHDWYF
jgi:uncharacterized membrane protein (DUF4010 family)